MSMNKSKIDIVGGFVQIVIVLGIYGAYKVAQFIWLLVMGSTAEVAISGDVAVPSVINDTINDTVQSVADGFQKFFSAESVTLGLLVLVVILNIFWPLISMYMPKIKGYFGGGKGGGMN